MIQAQWTVHAGGTHVLICPGYPLGRAFVYPPDRRGGAWYALWGVQGDPPTPRTRYSHWQLARRAVEARLAGVVEVVR